MTGLLFTKIASVAVPVISLGIKVIEAKMAQKKLDELIDQKVADAIAKLGKGE